MGKTSRDNIEVRNSAKIVLLNDENELLLIGIDDKNIKDQKGEYKGRFWQLIGGKIEDQESIEDALKRELFEETGLTEKYVEFGPIIWQGELNLLMYGIQTRVKQKFVLTHLKRKADLNLNHLTQEEKGTVTELK